MIRQDLQDEQDGSGPKKSGCYSHTALAGWTIGND